MSETANQRSREFLQIADQFKLGVLTTESSHPTTADLSEVAQGDIAAGLRRLPQQMNMVQTHGWHRQEPNLGSLYEAKIGLIGLGAVGRWFVELLKPFHPEIRVYDPYLKAENLPASPPMRL